MCESSFVETAPQGQPLINLSSPCLLGLSRLVRVRQPAYQWPSQRWILASVQVSLCGGSLPEHHGPIFYTKRVPVEVMAVFLLLCYPRDVDGPVMR